MLCIFQSLLAALQRGLGDATFGHVLLDGDKIGR